MDFLTFDNYIYDPFLSQLSPFFGCCIFKFLLAGVMQVQSKSTIIDQKSKNKIAHEESVFTSPWKPSEFSSPEESSESTVSVNYFVDSKMKRCVKSTSTNSKDKGKKR